MHNVTDVWLYIGLYIHVCTYTRHLFVLRFDLTDSPEARDTTSTGTVDV